MAKKNIEKKTKKMSKVAKNDKVALENAKKEEKKPGIFEGFFEFLKQYSVIGLAIGLVIGSTSQELVQAIADGLINPLIGLFLINGTGTLTDIKPELFGQEFLVGQVLLATIRFLITLLIIYVIVKLLLRRDDLLQKK